MKIQLLVLTSLLVSQLSNATIWRWNNTGYTGTYASAQLAHDMASAGDTIQLEPGGNCGDLTIIKIK